MWYDLVSIHVPASVDVDSVVLHISQQLRLSAKRRGSPSFKVRQSDGLLTKLPTASIEKCYFDINCSYRRSRVTNLSADEHSRVGIFKLFIHDLKRLFCSQSPKQVHDKTYQYCEREQHSLWTGAFTPCHSLDSLVRCGPASM